MRLSVMVLAFVCLCAVVAGLAAPTFQPFQEEDVRGAFMTSRPKEKPANSGTATKPSRRRPKQTAPPTNTGKPPEKHTGKSGDSGKSGSSEPSKPVNVPRLGVG